MSHGDDDDSGDDAQLRSLRAVWLAMPDEDPPERGLDAIMAAARTKATEMAEASSELPQQDAAESWWKRFVATFLRPPVLALATVLVLVAGAVLVGNRGVKAIAPTGTSAPSTEDVPTQLREKESLKQEAPPPPQDNAVPSQAPHHDVRPRLSGPGNAEGVAKEATAPDVQGKQDFATNGEDKVSDQARAETAKDRLLHQAKTAAVRGDCNGARNVARQLEQQDLGYYQTRVVPDRDISDCLQQHATGGAAIERATTTTPAD